MLSKKEFRFERRSILTAAQLRGIEKFPREFLRLMFSEYGDGIIAGFDFVEREGKIFATEGLIKIGAEFYFADETDLSELIRKANDGVDYRLILGEPQRGNAIEGVITEKISLEAAKLSKDNVKLEFGRFRGGMSHLPSIEAKDLFDAFTQKICFNLLHVAYSTRGGTTFHPYIFRAILSKLSRKENPSPADTSLMIHLANFGIASLPALKIYVDSSNGCTWQENSREDILKCVLAATDSAWEIHLSESPSTTAPNNPTPSENGGFILW